jgi:hypothetical protein
LNLDKYEPKSQKLKTNKNYRIVKINLIDNKKSSTPQILDQSPEMAKKKIISKERKDRSKSNSKIVRSKSRKSTNAIRSSSNCSKGEVTKFMQSKSGSIVHNATDNNKKLKSALSNMQAR